VKLVVVKCYIPDCTNKVIGHIIPKKNPDKTPLLVCEYHYNVLSEIFSEPEYTEGWFTAYSV